MTIQQEAAAHEAQDELEPLPTLSVLVANPPERPARNAPQAADYGAWTSYSLAGTEAAQPILPYDPNRARAVIIVSGAAGLVYVGTQSQVQQKLGGIINVGTPPVDVRNNQALYLAPDGTHPVTVTVLTERWDSEV